MWRWLWLSLVVVLLDQATKWLAERYLTYLDPVPVLPVFDLTLMYNTGAAFSLLASAGGWQRWFFLVLTLVVSAGLLVWIGRLRRDQRLLGASLGLILGGAIGNLIDRIWHGHVIDFLSFHYAGWYFPAFNIADSAITVGAILLVLDSLLEHRALNRQRMQS